MIRPIEEVDPEFAEPLKFAIDHRVDKAYPFISIKNTQVFVHSLYGSRVEIHGDPDIIPNRNDPCFCGSTLKFKKCCGA